MNNKLINIACVLIVIWTFLMMHTMVNISTSGQMEGKYGYAPTLLLLVVEVMGFIALVSGKRHSLLGKNILVFFIYSTFINLLLSNNFIRDFRDANWWILIFYLFYYFSVSDTYSIMYNKIMKYLPFFSLGILVMFHVVYSAKRNLMFGGEFLQVNDIFWVVTFMPMLFFLKKRLIKYMLLFLSILTCVYSLKRSAIIISGLILAVLLYYDFMKNGKNKIVGIFIIIILLTGGVFAYNYIDEVTGGLVTKRMDGLSEDKGSGRESIYESVWNRFNNQEFESKLLGNGFNTVRQDKVSGGDAKSAHNDYLEVMYDYGIIGLIIYLLFTIQLFKRIFQYRKYDQDIFMANVTALIVFSVMSMVSHLMLYPTYFIFIAAVWGISEGYVMRRKSESSR